MQSEIDSLREINSKLLAEITELKKENAEVKAENVKLKHALEEHEARFTSLEQRDEEKATLIAKLDDDIKEIKQSSASTSSVENSDICQPIHTETKSLEEKEMDNFLVEADKKIVNSEIKRRNKEKKLQRESACKDLIKEISTSISCNAPIQNQSRSTSHDSISQVTEISLTSGQGKSDILQNIANLYEKACDAEDVSIKANQAEILCWSNFIIAFDKSIEEIMARDRVGMKKAKGLIYDFILAQNPDTKRPALYKKIERARKIYRLTEKIGLDKVKYIKTYSANTISKFTNEEIQRVIDHFTKNPDMGFTDDPEDGKQDDGVPERLDQNNVSEVQVHLLDSAKTRSSTAPIPLTHVSDSSGDSSSPGSLSKAEVSKSFIPGGRIRGRLPISVLPEEKRKDIIGLVLERFPYLSLEYSESYGDSFVFNSSVSCPICKKDHEGENIKGGWGSDMYSGEQAYYLECYEAFNREIPIVSVKA